MKKTLILVASMLTLVLSAEDSLPGLDWTIQDGKMTNWSGKVEPLEGGGMQLSGKDCISYSKKKFQVKEKRNVRIRFAVQGYGSMIGIYCYGKGRLAGNFMERIPNSENRKDFEAVFAIPQQMKDTPIDSFRVLFSSSTGMKVYQVEMFLEE